MFPGVNPKQMQQMMKKMGMKQVDIPATEVIIKTPDKDLVITDPQVIKVNMMGQDTIQITGQIYEREHSSEVEIEEDDIKTVAEQANVSEDKAKKALDASKGDIAQAILSLSE